MGLFDFLRRGKDAAPVVGRISATNYGWTSYPEMNPVVSAVMAYTADAVAAMDVAVYQAVDGGPTARAKHSIDALLRTPNRYQIQSDYFATVAADLVLHRESISVIERRAVGSGVVSIMPVQFDRVRMSVDDNGNQMYSMQIYGESFTDVPAEKVMHYKMGGLWSSAISPKTAMAQDLRTHAALKQAIRQSAEDGFKRTGTLNVPVRLSKEQREAYRDEFMILSGGGPRALLVAEQGVGFTATSDTLRESEAARLLELAASEIQDYFPAFPAAIIKGESVPPHEYERWRETGLLPIVRVIEQTLERHLFSASDRAKYRVRFDFASHDRANPRRSSVDDARKVQGGIITPNEARENIGREPLNGGDRLLVQQQMISLHDTGSSDEKDSN